MNKPKKEFPLIMNYTVRHPLKSTLFLIYFVCIYLNIKYGKHDILNNIIIQLIFSCRAHGEIYHIIRRLSHVRIVN